jgi:hypothetical protein
MQDAVFERDPTFQTGQQQPPAQEAEVVPEIPRAPRAVSLDLLKVRRTTFYAIHVRVADSV